MEMKADEMEIEMGRENKCAEELEKTAGAVGVVGCKVKVQCSSRSEIGESQLRREGNNYGTRLLVLELVESDVPILCSAARVQCR